MSLMFYISPKEAMECPALDNYTKGTDNTCTCTYMYNIHVRTCTYMYNIFDLLNARAFISYKQCGHRR